jgi:hypothetical protein
MDLGVNRGDSIPFLVGSLHCCVEGTSLHIGAVTIDVVVGRWVAEYDCIGFDAELDTVDLVQLPDPYVAIPSNRMVP